MQFPQETLCLRETKILKMLNQFKDIGMLMWLKLIQPIMENISIKLTVEDPAAKFFQVGMLRDHCSFLI